MVNLYSLGVGGPCDLYPQLYIFVVVSGVADNVIISVVNDQYTMLFVLRIYRLQI